MRGIAAFAVAFAIAVPAVGGPVRAPLIELPLLVTATVCGLPSTSCPRADEVVRLVAGGAERQVGFADLRVLQGSVTSGEIFAELRVRPVRLFGPEEELAKLGSGTPLKMRAVLRLGARYLFVESLEPITAKPGA